nr:ORF18 [Acipenserid herpesvirus 1]
MKNHTLTDFANDICHFFNTNYDTWFTWTLTVIMYIIIITALVIIVFFCCCSCCHVCRCSKKQKCQTWI